MVHTVSADVVDGETEVLHVHTLAPGQAGRERRQAQRGELVVAQVEVTQARGQRRASLLIHTEGLWVVSVGPYDTEWLITTRV